MANNKLNQLELPNGTTYDLEDSYARKLTNNDFDTINVTELNAGDLIVTGVGRFTNGLYGNLSGTATQVSNNLKVQLNSGTTEGTNQFTYNGSAAKTVNITKSGIGLGNVENKSSATIRSELTSSNVTTALGYTPLNSTLKGANNGVAELDANGLVPSSQLPSYVDDVLEYSSKSAFPATGETGKIYVATDTNLTYRWSGSAYTEISPSLALGETSSTAYRGDRGATAYSHATDSSRLTTATASGLYKVASTAQGHIASLTAVTKADITGLGIPGSDTNTHRPIQVNGTEILGNNTTALNLKAGTNVSLTNSSGTVTIASTDTNTTYSLSTSGESVVLSGSDSSSSSVSLSTLINGLSAGASNATTDDYIVAQYAGGGTTTTSYHRRKLSNIFAALPLATGDSNGQVKINGTNVSVKGLGSNAYTNTAYLPLAGGTMTGTLTAKGSVYDDAYTGSLNMNNSNIYGVNSIYTVDVSDSAAEGINFYRDATHVDTLWMTSGQLLFVPNRTLGTNTSAANSQKVGRFTANPTSGQVVITDGTTGGLKTSDFTVSGNAGFHNSIYRGKSLGTSITTAQWASISAGTFDDMYIGDYWTLSTTIGSTTSNVQYVIAGFDYWWNCGDSFPHSSNKHHVVLVPASYLYTAQMNTSNVVTGGYIGSAMYTDNLANARTGISTLFGDHLYSVRRLFTNSVNTVGQAIGWAWATSTVDLMSETMVYGHPVWSTSGFEVGIDRTILPLFALNPASASIRPYWWLRSVATPSDFALVDSYGLAGYSYASYSLGVRPAFAIF